MGVNITKKLHTLTLLINSGGFYFAFDLLLFLRIFFCGIIPSVMTVIRLARDW